MFKLKNDENIHYGIIGFGGSGCTALDYLSASMSLDNLEFIYIPSSEISRGNTKENTPFLRSDSSNLWLSIVLADALDESNCRDLQFLLSELKTKSHYSVVITNKNTPIPSNASLLNDLLDTVDSCISLYPQNIESFARISDQIDQDKVVESSLAHLAHSLLSFVLQRGVYGIDSSDLKQALAGHGLVTAAVAGAQGENRAKSAFDLAIKNLDNRSSKHGNVAVCIWASNDFSTQELHIIEELVDQYTDGASIVDLQWHDDLNNQCLITMFETELPSM